LLSVSGDRARELEAYRQVEELYQASRSLPFAVLLGVHMARLKLWEEGIETIPDWTGLDQRISPLDLPVENLPISVREVQLISQARLYLHAGQPEKILGIDGQVCSTAEPGDRLARVIEISLLKALSLQELGDLPGALAALERSLILSGPEGYLRLYLDEGEPAHAHPAGYSYRSGWPPVRPPGRELY
jgi:LuxR family maltose regulon positive regulatory protein